MSASNENKPRQDLTGTNMSDPKTAREAQQRKEERRSNRLYALIAIVFVIVAIVSITWKSNIIQKRATAVSINGQNYTAAEVNYQFRQIYQTFVNQNYQYLTYLGLDTSADLRSQQFGEDQTWFDYFLEQALQQMVTVKALNDAAAADGYTWTDDLQTELDSNLESLKTNITSYGYTSFAQYLASNYGSSMTEKTFTQQLKNTLLAQSYATAYSDSLVYSTEDLAAAYSENPNAYDQVNYQSIRISGAVATTDADGNTVEVTDEMTAQAMATAKATADRVYAAWQAGESLADVAQRENLTLSDIRGGTYSSGVLSDWLFDSTRQNGDSAVLEDADSSAYYVAVFAQRLHDYQSASVRHILVKVDETDLDATADTYAADLQAKKDEAKAKAEDLLAQWKSGDATEDSFATLANENSEDTGSNTTGGLYENFFQGQMVVGFNDWCFDAARKSGDTGVVYGESSSYKGYHVIYFVGNDDAGLPYWEQQASSALTNDAVEAWYTEKTADYTAEQHSFGMRFVG